MAATTGYQAGIEANNTQISYGVEATWGTTPAVAFQAIRMTSETLALNRTRQRPLEINTTREAAAQVTTQSQAGGAINFALSYGTFDDFFGIALGNEFSSALTIAGVAGDITFTNVSATTGTLSSGTSNKFLAVVLGSFIRLLGFTNTANNGIWRVSAKASNTSITLQSPRLCVTETPATTLAKVRGQTMVNSTEFRSMYIQNSLSSTLYLTYPGSFISGFTLQGQLGQFFNGSFNVLAKSETKQTSDQSTGAIVAAPGGRVVDPVSGFMACLIDGVSSGVTIDQLSLTVNNTGAAAEFGMGSASAAGILQGYLEASGSFRCYFANFTMYDLFVAELGHVVSFLLQDSDTAAYVFTALNAAFSAGKIDAGGPGQPVYATFEFACDPQTTGGTFQLDKLPTS